MAVRVTIATPVIVIVVVIVVVGPTPTAVSTGWAVFLPIRAISPVTATIGGTLEAGVWRQLPDLSKLWVQVKLL